MNWQAHWKLAWIKASRVYARTLLAFFQVTLFRSIQEGLRQGAFKRVLVYRIGNLGDILVTVPCLAAIRAKFPEAHITLLTSPGLPGAPGAEHILPTGKWYDDLIVYYTPAVRSWSGRLNLIRQLRAANFDLFIELSNQQSRPREEIRNMLTARFAGCRYGTGFAVSQQGHFLREQLLHLPQQQEARRIFSSISEELALDAYRDIPLCVTNDDQREVSTVLRGKGIQEGEPYVVMHTGAKRQTNQWPPERYAYVADEIKRRWGIPVVLTGSKSDLPLANQIATLMRENPVVLCGSLSLRQLIAVLAGSLLYVGNDTGPMHIAASVGTKAVAIFSARDFPNRWSPTGDGHLTLRHDAPCSPCFRESCNRDQLCIKAITIQDVLAAVETQFNALKFPVLASTRSAQRSALDLRTK